MKFLACPECGWVYIAPPRGKAICDHQFCTADEPAELRSATDEEVARVHALTHGQGQLHFASTLRDFHNDKPRKKAASQASLEDWRTIPPSQLVERKESLLDLLVAKTGAADAPSRTILTRAASFDAEAMLAVGDMMGKRYGSDLCWSWVTCAALHGNNAARVQLAAALVGRGLWDDSRTMLRRQRLAWEWIAPIAREMSQFSDARQKLWNNLADSGLPHLRQLMDEKSTPPAETTVEAAGPSLVVCKEIPAVRNDRDDQAFIAAWSCLTKPLPLILGPPSSTVRGALLLEYPWAEAAIEAITADLELREQMGLPWSGFRPTLLVGPPGTGKTSLARRLASHLGLGYGEMSAAGSSDNRLLAGTARGWGSCMPSFVLQVMRRGSCANPLLLMDELDKCRPDGRNGDVRQTLLGMLEPTTAKRWLDEGLGYDREYERRLVDRYGQ